MKLVLVFRLHAGPAASGDSVPATQRPARGTGRLRELVSNYGHMGKQGMSRFCAINMDSGWTGPGPQHIARSVCISLRLRLQLQPALLCCAAGRVENGR